MQEDILKIIDDGIKAPSGENCQPWRFEIENNKISVFNIPEADQSLYNFKQKGSYVAHGALIENIVISSAHFGYDTSVEIPQHIDDSNRTCTITLNKTAQRDEPLYEYIAKRCTNRKSHKDQVLSESQKDILVGSAKEGGTAAVTIIDDKALLGKLGTALAVNEQIIFENKELHDFFYAHVLWKPEDETKAGGFYYKTLEFLPSQLKGVKLFKNWFVLSVLNKVAKVSHVVAKENAEKYSKSAALALISVNGGSDKDFIEAGRSMERVWLTATKLGLSVHPCTGVLFFMNAIKGGNTATFSEKHLAMIKEAYADIENSFNASGKTLPMLFRIGYADAPTATSKRVKPNVQINHV